MQRRFSERVLATLKLAAIRQPSTSRLVISCCDRRIRPAEAELCLLEDAFSVAVPAAQFAPGGGPAVAMLCKLGPNLDAIYHIGHTGCAALHDARNPNSSSADRWGQQVARLELNAGVTDEDYAKEQIKKIRRYPIVAQREGAGLLQVVGFLITAEGLVKCYNLETSQYE